jgi:ketosteroid isomerase-like protein
MTMAARAIVAAAITVGACGGSVTVAPPPPTVPAAPTVAPPPIASRALLGELAVLATGEAATDEKLDAWREGLAMHTTSTDAIIDELLHDPRFLRRITRVFLWDRTLYEGIGRFVRLPGWILKKTDGDDPIYYLRKPCTAAVAQLVRPWWAMTTTVKVCPDSHRPTVTMMDANRYCTASAAAPNISSTCGCGPNLMRCAPSKPMSRDFKRQFVAEIEDTVADIVDRDLPLKTVYLTNETVRQPLVELQYQSWRVERRELATLPDVLATWPAQGQRAPRYEDMPGDHAGILTAVGAMWQSGGLRPWMRTVQQSMWCAAIDNSHVDSLALFEAAVGGNANLRGGDGWKRLANHPVCSSCHARMDYGWQFFLGYPDFPIATHYVPPKGRTAAKLHAVGSASANDVPDARLQIGKLYMDNIDDLRAERPQLPLEYAKWAVEQPEFAACQARRVTEHVFGPDATPADREAIAQVYASTERFRPMMREALRRYVQRQLSNVSESAPAAPQFVPAAPASVGAAAAAQITLLPETLALLERHCLDCHGSDVADPTKNFEVQTLSRERLIEVLSYVSDRRMPKTTAGLDPAERRRFLTVLISNLWSSDVDRLAALEFFDNRMLATTVERPEAVLSTVYQRAGAVPSPPAQMLEVSITSPQLELTPGLAARVAVEALRGCKAAGARDLAACVERASSVDGIIREPNRAPVQSPLATAIADTAIETTRGAPKMIRQLLVPLAFALVAVDAGAALADDQAVRAANDAFTTSAMKSDVAALDKLFADDLVFVHGGGFTETKAVFLDHMKTGKRKIESVEQKNVQVRVYGTTAIVSGTAQIKLVWNGNKLDNAILFSSVWVQQAGKWRMVQYQATPQKKDTPPAAPAAAPPPPKK